MTKIQIYVLQYDDSPSYQWKIYAWLEEVQHSEGQYVISKDEQIIGNMLNFLKQQKNAAWIYTGPMVKTVNL